MPLSYEAFGLSWRSDLALPGFDPASPDVAAAEDDDAVEVVRSGRLLPRASGSALGRGSVHPDGFRFASSDDAVFDMFRGRRILYAPGPEWTGSMPWSFYGTVAALTAAWRGMVPLHACAVELDGRAVLIAGAPAAGKSTLAAGLIASGARFLADDLSVAAVGSDGTIRVMRGRPTMRLHRDTALEFPTLAADPAADDPRGKWLVRPSCRSGRGSLSLGTIVLLTDQATVGHAHPRDLFPHVFRRRWMDALPMRNALMRDVLAIAARTPMLGFPSQGGMGPASRRHRAERAIDTVRGLLADGTCMP